MDVELLALIHVISARAGGSSIVCAASCSRAALTRSTRSEPSLKLRTHLFASASASAGSASQVRAKPSASALIGRLPGRTVTVSQRWLSLRSAGHSRPISPGQSRLRRAET